MITTKDTAGVELCKSFTDVIETNDFNAESVSSEVVEQMNQALRQFTIGSDRELDFRRDFAKNLINKLLEFSYF